MKDNSEIINDIIEQAECGHDEDKPFFAVIDRICTSMGVSDEIREAAVKEAEARARYWE